MFRRILMFFALVSLLSVLGSVGATSQIKDCDLLGQENKFECHNRNWVLQKFNDLIEESRSNYIIYVMKGAGCKFPNLNNSPIKDEIDQCMTQLQQEFACKVTISVTTRPSTLKNK